MQLGDTITAMPVTTASAPPYVAQAVYSYCVSASIYVTPAATGSAVQVLAANPARRHAIYMNNSPNQVWLGYGFKPNSFLFSEAVPSLPNKSNSVEHYDFPYPIYTGVVYAIWDGSAAPSGTMLITEFT